MWKGVWKAVVARRLVVGCDSSGKNSSAVTPREFVVITLTVLVNRH